MNWQAFKKLFSYIKHYKIRFILSVIGSIFGTGFTVIAPRLLGDITTILTVGVKDGIWSLQTLSDGSVDPDSVYTTVMGQPFGKVHTIIALIVLITIIYCLSFLFCGFANNSFARITALIIKDMRTDIDVKMHSLKLDYFDTHVNGDVLSVITNDIDAVNTLLSKNLYQIISSAVTLVGVLIMLLTSNIWMALIAAALVPLTM